MIPVSVIILTYNEETNIAECVRALDAFDEVIVVDSGSTDRTLEILRSESPRVRILSNSFEDFGQQRNWAIDNTNPAHPWVLFVDADEFMEKPLAEEINAFVSSPGDAVGAFIAGRNYFLGRWLKYSTYFPSYQLRLLKQGAVRYRREGHGQREETTSKTVYLKNSWRHEGFSQGIHHWIDRHNRYSTAEAPLISEMRTRKVPWKSLLARDAITRRRAIKLAGSKLPGRPVTRFLYTYVVRFGFLDGYAGFLFNLLRFTNDIHICTKVAERKWRCGNTERSSVHTTCRQR
ncbi:MAG: glycosyltransferase family 2 protein [Candidatus Paceibacterota bacterium]